MPGNWEVSQSTTTDELSDYNMSGNSRPISPKEYSDTSPNSLDNSSSSNSNAMENQMDVSGNSLIESPETNVLRVSQNEPNPKSNPTELNSSAVNAIKIKTNCTKTSNGDSNNKSDQIETQSLMDISDNSDIKNLSLSESQEMDGVEHTLNNEYNSKSIVSNSIPNISVKIENSPADVKLEIENDIINSSNESIKVETNYDNSHLPVTNKMENENNIDKVNVPILNVSDTIMNESTIRVHDTNSLNNSEALRIMNFIEKHESNIEEGSVHMHKNLNLTQNSNAEDLETEDANNIQNNTMDVSLSNSELRPHSGGNEIVNITHSPRSELDVPRSELDESVTPILQVQEVIDVESYQPCVVDLTCEEENNAEEDDDIDVVDIVNIAEPVIFVGTNQNRRRRRHDRRNDAPRENSPIQLDLTENTVLDQVDEQEAFEEEPHDISDNENDDRPGYLQAALDEELRELMADNEGHDMPVWPPINAPPEIDLQNPTLTFGNLLGERFVETVEEDTQDDPPPPENEEGGPLFQPREREIPRFRRRSRRLNRSRSRSPTLFDLPADDDDNIIPGAMGNNNPDAWNLPVEAPIQLPLMDNEIMADVRLPVIPAPRPPPSPPPVQQPTITCLVCLDSLATINSSNRSLCSTVCGHVFCSACIEEVVKQRKQCPVCRKKLNKRQYHPLFI